MEKINKKNEILNITVFKNKINLNNTLSTPVTTDKLSNKRQPESITWQI
tara:strand:+ start:985 stop:1131 length:147 start_codon:yes stop_codon:yes gene_type:complete